MKRLCRQVLLGALGSFLLAVDAVASAYLLPPADIDLIGAPQWTAARAEDTLLDIARRYDIGQDEILLANPGVDRWLPGAGTEVLIPSAFLLPAARRRGLVLNLPEMRVYYFGEKDAAGTPLVVTHPVSIGRIDWRTPLGEARILSKARDPVWRPPQSLRDEAAASGEVLPEAVPPGPDNPLGRYALYLSRPGYLIHGTNKPFGVGMRVTHGCIRMYPEDIEEFFERVPVGTPVQIVNQPIKLGWHADTLYVEMHPWLEEDREGAPSLQRLALELIYQALEERPALLDGAAVTRAIEKPQGMPVPISR